MSENIDGRVPKQTNQNDELSILDLVGVILRYKWFIMGVTAIAAITVFLYCYISIKLPVDKTYMPNLYKPKAEMLINEASSSSGVASALNSSGLGNLASILGGSSGGGSSNVALAQYLVTSPSIQDAIIDRFYKEKIEESYKKSVEELKRKGKYKPEEDKWKFPYLDTRDMLSKKIVTSYSSGTGVFSIAVEDKDPQLACDIINYTVELLEKRFVEIGVDKNKLTMTILENNIDIAYKNILELQNKTQVLDRSIIDLSKYPNDNLNVVLDTALLQLELEVQKEIYSNLKTQYETMKVTIASEKPVFQILEYAQIPDKKSGPSRGKKCIVFTMASFFISIILSFAINLFNNVRKDPVAMAKLRPNKKGE